MEAGIEQNNVTEGRSEQMCGSYRTHFPLIYKKTSWEIEGLIVYHKNDIPKKLLSCYHKHDTDV